MIALASAPWGVSAKSHPFRPTTKGRMAFSTWLLLISISPCSRNVQRWAFWFWAQVLSCASLHSFSSLLVFWIPVFQVLWISIARLKDVVSARDYWAVTWHICLILVERYQEPNGWTCRSAPSNLGRITEDWYLQKEFHRAFDSLSQVKGQLI